MPKIGERKNRVAVTFDDNEMQALKIMSKDLKITNQRLIRLLIIQEYNLHYRYEIVEKNFLTAFI